MTSIGSLHAEKIAEAILLYLFKIAFPASLFPQSAFAPFATFSRSVMSLTRGAALIAVFVCITQANTG